MKTLTVTVSPAPGNANSKRGRSYHVSKRERDRVGKEVFWQLATQNLIGRTFAECDEAMPFQRPARIRLHRRAYNRMDPMAVIESAKPVIDALVENGVLVDDRHPYISGEPVVTQEVVRDKRRPGWSSLEVTLEEME